MDAMALIAGARGLVSNDSGLMHVAAAFGIPQVAVFGSTSPEHTPPLNPRARVLWLKDELGLDCMPCFERDLPLRPHALPGRRGAAARGGRAAGRARCLMKPPSSLRSRPPEGALSGFGAAGRR